MIHTCIFQPTDTPKRVVTEPPSQGAWVLGSDPPGVTLDRTFLYGIASCAGTLRKNLGNGSFADFLSAISVKQFYRIWHSPILVILPIKSGPINRDRAQPDPIRPDRESILVMLPIEDPILVMGRSATMPKNGALLLHRACPDEPDDGKYEYYYVSYSYW